MTLTSEAVPDAPSRAHPVGQRGYGPFLVATAVVLVAVSTVAVWTGAASLSFADVFAVCPLTSAARRSIHCSIGSYGDYGSRAF